MVLKNMSKVTYHIDDLHNLVNFGLRNNMVSNNLANTLLPDLVNDFTDNLLQKGSPIRNSFYKNMNLTT